MSTLLPFHKAILEEIHDPATSDLLVLARGLGLRRIICTLMRIYNSNKNLVLLVNASPGEESAIGEELGITGCRRPGLRVVGYETPGKDRQELYKRGGLISVTSRILVVDMLQEDIPVQLITGMLILHAEKITPLVNEAFIVRLFRERNRNGFIKAFTDQPEHVTTGLSPLKNIMKELQLRRVHLYPRFHVYINKSLERRRADVVELSQPLSDSMLDIHGAIIQCMTTTLSELKRSNTNLDLEDLNIENAYFRSFDAVVRFQLASVWHKVGPKTKQLVNDLNVLRQLLFYLLSYDSLSFHAYLETIIESNTISASGSARVHQSPWLLTDAANMIFGIAKRRCFVPTHEKTISSPPVIDADDEDTWAALDELDNATPIVGTGNGKGRAISRPAWLPETIQPILEEQPKWDLLSEILLEIESETDRFQSRNLKPGQLPGNDTVLIMTSSTMSCDLIQEFLDCMNPVAEPGRKGTKMMQRRLKGYLSWRGRLGSRDRNGASTSNGTIRGYLSGVSNEKGKGKEKGRDEIVTDALRREKAGKATGRRRARGGALSNSTKGNAGGPSTGTNTAEALENEKFDVDKVDEVMAPWTDETAPTGTIMSPDNEIDLTLLTQADFETAYGLLPAEQTIVIRAYSDDTDDRLLAEIQPRFVIMFEPCVEFIRRIEVYRSSYAGLAVRVYHMVYANSCEEHRYLAAIRREKEAFERLVKERGTMLVALEERRDPEAAAIGESSVRTISTRLAGGRRVLNKESSKIVVDMREFRSTLPSLLHAASVHVIPVTLTTGDYVLTPDICVERKSLSDLVQSFTSGRLYTQCELMSVHYKHPILLIEFEEDKAFSLEVISEMKSHTKPTQKHPKKPVNRPATFGASVNDPTNDPGSSIGPTIQSKLVLLTLSFPCLRIIWSSSPHATADIFMDLKKNQPEPDQIRAIVTGAEGDPDAGKGVNTVAEELLRSLPGIGSDIGAGRSVVGAVMRRCKSVQELCGLREEEVKALVGIGPGKILYEFLHTGK